MAAATDEALAPARVAGMVVPTVIALVVFILIAIFGAVLAVRGNTNTGAPSAGQQAASRDVNAQKNSFSGK